MTSVYPLTFDRKTGFDLLRELLAAQCATAPGRRKAASLAPSADAEQLVRLLGETREFLTILQTALPFPGPDGDDPAPALHRIRPANTWLPADELAELRRSLATILDCLAFFRLPAAQSFTRLIALTEGISVPHELLRETDRAVDEKGMVRDDASPELRRIRNDIRRKAAATEQLIGRLLQNARSAGWTSPDAEVTLSDGRLVIPLLATHKRKLKGIVHSESATGQTVFLEPDGCLELNNEIRELESAEHREIIRILIGIADLFRPHIDTLLAAGEFLAEIDFIRAKARLASLTSSDLPRLSPGPAFNWRNARHPLLELSLRSKGKTIVPLNLRLDATERILVITGPNAGGKSVCLKTAGLLQYMLQHGLLVPMDPDSTAGIFDHLCIDIGDEQSLENDLSTYSSHLLSLARFISDCNDRSLFLADELGAGTDPALGGAIAEATLEKLAGTGAYGIVTTHFSNLKLLAGKVPGIVNGAMLFDTGRLEPLYILATGKPGSSFTFEIARRIGFPADVIEAAIGKAGRTHLDFERQLQEVESEKLRLERRLKEFHVADGFLGELIDKYERMNADLERSRREILEKAREEARDLLERSNRAVEQTIRQIRESQAEKEQTRAARTGLEAFRQQVSAEPPAPKAQDPKPEAAAPRAFRTGDTVSVAGRPGHGVIRRIKGQQAQVDFGGLLIHLPLDRLTRAQGQSPRSGARANPYLRDLNEKSVNFRLTLDLRGKMADEALQLVQKYLDDAYLLRIREVSILHGKGYGILRKVIREYLAGCDEVDSYRDDDPDQGGTGITRVVLK